jgi:hypothetical protein
VKTRNFPARGLVLLVLRQRFNLGVQGFSEDAELAEVDVNHLAHVEAVRPARGLV